MSDERSFWHFLRVNAAVDTFERTQLKPNLKAQLRVYIFTTCTSHVFMCREMPFPGPPQRGRMSAHCRFSRFSKLLSYEPRWPD